MIRTRPSIAPRTLRLPDEVKCEICGVKHHRDEDCTCGMVLCRDCGGHGVIDGPVYAYHWGPGYYDCSPESDELTCESCEGCGVIDLDGPVSDEDVKARIAKAKGARQ